MHLGRKNTAAYPVLNRCSVIYFVIPFTNASFSCADPIFNANSRAACNGLRNKLMLNMIYGTG